MSQLLSFLIFLAFLVSCIKTQGNEAQGVQSRKTTFVDRNRSEQNHPDQKRARKLWAKVVPRGVSVFMPKRHANESIVRDFFKEHGVESKLFESLNLFLIRGDGGVGSGLYVTKPIELYNNQFTPAMVVIQQAGLSRLGAEDDALLFHVLMHEIGHYFDYAKRPYAEVKKENELRDCRSNRDACLEETRNGEIRAEKYALKQIRGYIKRGGRELDFWSVVDFWKARVKAGEKILHHLNGHERVEWLVKLLTELNYPKDVPPTKKYWDRIMQAKSKLLFHETCLSTTSLDLSKPYDADQDPVGVCKPPYRCQAELPGFDDESKEFQQCVALRKAGGPDL